jgi:hypothetical protein
MRVWIASTQAWLALACACADPVAESFDTVDAQGVAVRCEPMSDEALAAVLPPRPEGLDSVADLVGSALEPTCPPGFVPRYEAVAIPVRAHEDGAGRAASAAVSGNYYYAGVIKPTGNSKRGVGGILSIDNPALYVPGDMATGEISIVQGANKSLVETGYRKFMTAGPTLMIGHWVNKKFERDDDFVYTHQTYVEGMPLDGYVGTQRQFLILYASNKWWVWFNDDWVGYFPDSIWAADPFTQGDNGHWYGEVYSSGLTTTGYPESDMGNGLRGGSNPSAANIDRMCLYNDLSCGLISNGLRSVTASSLYSLHYAGAAFMRYGGPGRPSLTLP